MLQVMTENIDRILDRGDKIELLVDKSSDLVEQVSDAVWLRVSGYLLIEARHLGVLKHTFIT